MPPTLDEVDRRIEERIAAEHEFMIGILAELLAHLQRDAEMRGPPGPAGPRGEQGPPGLMPLVKLWMPETVYYEGDVVAHDGGTFQAKRDRSAAVARRLDLPRHRRPRRQEHHRARHVRRDCRLSSSRRRRVQRRQLRRAQG